MLAALFVLVLYSASKWGTCIDET